MPERLKQFEKNCPSRRRSGLLFFSLLFCCVMVSWPLQADELRSIDSATTAADNELSSTDSVATAADVVASVIYEDVLIDPDIAGQQFAEELIDYEAAPPGRRYLGIGYQHYQERQSPYDLTENGLVLTARRETRDYGEFDLQAALRKGDH